MLTKNLIKILSLLFVSLSISEAYTGQTLSQTVRGKVIDADTGEPLIGAFAAVLGEERKYSAVTDVEGNFAINEVPVGRVTIKCGFLGYEDNIISEILVTSAKEVNLKIRLRESFKKLEEVVIKAKKDNIKPNNNVALISARSFSVEETKRFPASISDPGRMALSYAGVSSADDETNEIVIRGNAPNQLLWRIEGMEVPSPNHFSEQGFSTGAVSILNSNMLERSDFFTGAFPAEYGNALSGVFDINLRSGNAKKREYAFQFGALGTDLTAEGPFSENYAGSYLVNYRYSTLALIDNFVEFNEDGGVPVFQDGSIKVNLPAGKRSVFSLWGIAGNSESNTDEAIEESYVYDEIFESRTYMGGLNFKHFFQNKSRLEARISASGTSSDFIYNERDTITNIKEKDSDLLSSGAQRINLNYFKKLNSRTSFKIGGIASFIRYDVESKYTEMGTEFTAVDKDGTGQTMQGFIQAKHRLNESMLLTGGLHSLHFTLNNQTSLEPRLGFEWVLNPKHTISAGIGVHSRTYSLNQYFVNEEVAPGVFETPNKDLDLMTANHFVIGYDWRLIKQGHLKIEAYYQQLNNVAVAKNSENTDAVVNGGYLDETLSDEGIGKNVGLDITFERFFSDQYYFLVTTSIFDSKYRAANRNWYDNNYNFGNTFNFVGGKEFTMGKEDNHTLGASIKLLSNGGRKGSVIDTDHLNSTGEYRFDQLKRNTVRLTPYFRGDVSVYYQINKPKVSHRVSLDIQNVSNQLNVGGQFIDSETGEIRTFTQLGLLPIINYKMEF